MIEKKTYIVNKEDLKLLERPLISPCGNCYSSSSYCCGCERLEKYEKMRHELKERNLLEVAEKLRTITQIESKIEELQSKIGDLKQQKEELRRELTHIVILDEDRNIK